MNNLTERNVTTWIENSAERLRHWEWTTAPAPNGSPHGGTERDVHEWLQDHVSMLLKHAEKDTEQVFEELSWVDQLVSELLCNYPRNDQWQAYCLLDLFRQVVLLRTVYAREEALMD